MWPRIAVGAVAATLLAYMATPVAIVAARRLAFFDRPIGYKGHGSPTPYLGGAAVMFAFALSIVVSANDARQTALLVGGVAVLWLVGTVDDRRTVSPLLRVAFELALGAILGASGGGWNLGGAGVDAAATAVWVAGVVNAFNLFDNMDGAASTMAIVATGGACILAVLTRNDWAAICGAALCGACLGFLPHNLAKPARIFLGDGGSMPLGFAVAALTASAATHAEPSVLALLTGLALVGLPALDTTLVVVSRRRRGISILTGGQDHLTHRTRARLRTARRVALVLGTIQAVVSALVIAATRADTAAVVYVVMAIVICGAAAIVGLEDRVVVAGAPAPAEGTGATLQVGGRPFEGRSRQAPRRPRRSGREGDWASAALLVVGLGAGLSALFSSYYSPTAWIPLGLGVVIVAAAACVTWPPTGFGLAARLSLCGLAGLGLWSLLSASWAHAVEQAIDQANLWLAYAAWLLLLCLLIRSRRRAVFLLAGGGAGIAVVAVTVLVRMLGSEPWQLFVNGRLNSPLGYINGEACMFVMGAWLSLSLAERRHPLAAGAGAAGGVAMACLALLSQSRGSAVAALAAIVVTLVAIPGFRRRTLALVVIGAGIALAAGRVLDVYSTAERSGLTAAVAHRAVVGILLASVASGVAWGLLSAVARWAERDRGPARVLLRRAGTALAILCIVVPAAVALARLPSIERTVRTQWHAFVNLSTTGSSSAATETRLLSGGGNRYDYWRVAWHVFLAHPVAGVGAGNYPAYYYELRRTQESIENPHSIELQTLSELGLVGALLLAALVAGAVLGAARLRSRARSSPIDRTLMVASLGVFVVWLVDSSGDWMQLLPGLSAVALAAVAVLCRSADEAREQAPGRARSRRAVPALMAAAAVAFLLVVGGASLLRSEFVQRYLADAQAAVGAHPAAAIVDAQRALRLDAANLDAYYIEAAGQARFDRAALARSTLLAAAREDPQDFVTWTLLGDLEVRLADFRAARAYYGRAHELDPLDPSLRRLATDPRSALSQ